MNDELKREICQQTGKVCYSQRDASLEIANFKKRKRLSHGKNIPQRSYICQFCGCYHLTHYRKKTSVKRFSETRMMKR